MNNEPVAWIAVGDNTSVFFDLDCALAIDDNPTPLYTHPVKEHDLGISHAIGFDDGFKAGMQRAVEMNVVKELTEEEVYQTWIEAKNTALTTGNSNPVEVIFARAILRKASEK